MDGTILGQGTFFSSYNGANPGSGDTVQAANPITIQIPSGSDWLKVYNYTQFGVAGTGTTYFQGSNTAYNGLEFYWQLGMAPGTGIVKYYGASGTVLHGDVLSSGCFTLYDPSGNNQFAQPFASNPVTTSAISNATQPVVSTTTTTGLSIGSIVRMSATSQTDTNGIDMVVGAVSAGSSFTLLTSTNALANVPGAVGGAGYYSIINFDPLYYPRNRFVTNITQAANAQVSTSVPHQYVVGQAVRFNIPAVSGMVQLNPTSANNYQSATIVSIVDQYNFTININTSSYTAFSWPTVAQQRSSFPEVTPIGENTAYALASTAPQTPIDYFGNQINATNTGILSDSTVNTGFIGMILGSGGTGFATISSAHVTITGPAGTVSFTGSNITSVDSVCWVAGKSTYGGQ